MTDRLPSTTLRLGLPSGSLQFDHPSRRYFIEFIERKPTQRVGKREMRIGMLVLGTGDA